jgi:integrase
VQVLSPHILALRNQVRDRQQADPSPERQVRGVAVLEEAVRRRIAGARPLDRLPQARISLRLSKGTFVPDDPLLNASFDSLAPEAGRSSFTYRRPTALRPVLLQVMDAVGVEQPWGRGAAEVTRADEQGSEVPRTVPIPEDQVRTLANQLRTACAMVTAAVSGMRISEIAELAVGCRRAEEPVPGMLRYRLASKVIKGRPTRCLSLPPISCRSTANSASSCCRSSAPPRPVARHGWWRWNRQVLGNLEQIITTLEADPDQPEATADAS